MVKTRFSCIWYSFYTMANYYDLKLGWVDPIFTSPTTTAAGCCSGVWDSKWEQRWWAGSKEESEARHITFSDTPPLLLPLPSHKPPGVQ